MRTDVLNRIKETLRKVIPAGGHAFLYGSQARNEARPDSDWGILILLDKPKIEVEDYDNISYPLVGLVVKRVRQPGALHLERLDEIPFLSLCTQRKRQGDTILECGRYNSGFKVQTHNGVVGQLELNYVSKGLLTKDES